MIWIGVAIGDHPAELLVATAAVKLIELHDVALQAKRDGSTFDPAEDDVETIYHRYALRRRLGDRRRCYWLSALTGVSREDFDAARVSLGPFAYNLEVVDDELAPCVQELWQTYGKAEGANLQARARPPPRRPAAPRAPRRPLTAPSAPRSPCAGGAREVLSHALPLRLHPPTAGHAAAGRRAPGVSPSAVSRRRRRARDARRTVAARRPLQSTV